MNRGNIFQASKLPHGDKELFETLVETEEMHIDRIISAGQTTPADEWYDQSDDEWVLLIQGKATIQWQDGSFEHLTQGDYLFIPARRRHRVSYTSQNPHCIWLAVHFSGQKLKREASPPQP